MRLISFAFMTFHVDLRKLFIGFIIKGKRSKVFLQSLNLCIKFKLKIKNGFYQIQNNGDYTFPLFSQVILKEAH